MTYDVIVIGGGIVGTALTYYLTQEKARVLLLERQRIASAASGGTMGMALWISLRDEQDISHSLAGQQRLATLSTELDANLNYRWLPSLVLAPDEASWHTLTHHLSRLLRAGFTGTMVGAGEIATFEPNLNAQDSVGALFAHQTHLDGAAMTQAYATAAQRQGAVIQEGINVTGFEHVNGHITAVHTPNERFAAAKMIITAGAWTRPLVAMVGINLPIYAVHGEALATEPVRPLLNGMVMLARPNGHSALERRTVAELGNTPWEIWQDDAEAQDVTMVQLRDGRLLIGQVSRALPGYHHALRTEAITRIWHEALRWLPALRETTIQRGWLASVPFTGTQQAWIGPVPGLHNLYACAGFKSALITVPVAMENFAKTIAGTKE